MASTFQSLEIAGVMVMIDPWNRYCLKGMHKASGKSPQTAPKIWLSLPETAALITAMEPICRERSLLNRSVPLEPILWASGLGPFVIRELVQAYAMWVSTEFHAEVLSVLRRTVTQPAKREAENSAPKLLERTVPSPRVPTISLKKFAASIGLESRDLHQMLRVDGVLIADGPDRNMPTKDQVSLDHLVEYEPDPVSCRPYRYVGVTHKGAQWLRERYAAE